MAGTNHDVDPDQCRHYAAFASHLPRLQFDIIYWVLFAGVILMLFFASYRYSRDHEASKDVEPGSREYRRRMTACMVWCLFLFSCAVVSVVMEVYALLALQFCDGEDLMSLYWSTWTMLQLGSLVAISGIILSVYNGIRGNKNPPWALALGTPVLVVAGIGHALQSSMRKRVDRVRSRSTIRSRRRPMSVSSGLSRLEGVTTGDIPISREETIRMDDSERDDMDFKARLVGYTPEGSPILQFLEDPGTIRDDRGTVIGRGERGVIVAFRKSMTTIIDGQDPENLNLKEKTREPGPSVAPSPQRPPPVVRIASPSPSPSRGRK
ncbi:hypothetical protein QBC34DRAFT_298946 [Podospora aff. communis PSN243]|uniref:Uncharacterized protein n=1 Tax=Podospora aff. communis PSN243 TaxID=3040156 RepID=A0AAV9GPS8_9PEZI|nr:hypothetical protein QBC34DRAFT_298946 [Podospora aff. communis PSN243]